MIDVIGDRFREITDSHFEISVALAEVDPQMSHGRFLHPNRLANGEALDVGAGDNHQRTVKPAPFLQD